MNLAGVVLCYDVMMVLLEFKCCPYARAVLRKPRSWSIICFPFSGLRVPAGNRRRFLHTGLALFYFSKLHVFSSLSILSTNVYFRKLKRSSEVTGKYFFASSCWRKKKLYCYTWKNVSHLIWFCFLYIFFRFLGFKIESLFRYIKKKKVF